MSGNHLATVALSTLAIAASSPASAAAEPVLTISDSSSAVAPQCSQFVFSVQADAAKVRPYVPDRFVFSRDVLGKAQLGYRMFSCPHLVVNGVDRGRVTWSELGVRTLPPEGLPELHTDTHVDGHDYYILSYHTDDRVLARGLRRIGIAPPGDPTLFARRMTYPRDAPTDESLTSPIKGTASETTRSGSYVTQLQGIVGPPKLQGDLVGDNQHVGLREWFVRPSDCRTVRLTEEKTNVNTITTPMALTVGPATLLGRAAGATSFTSLTDPFVIFNTDMVFDVVDAPHSALADTVAAVLKPTGGPACGA